MPDEVTLRELLEHRLSALEAKMDVAFLQRDSVLRTQAEEYARRLDELNHAHARAQVVLETYLTREIYETSQREFREWRDSVNNVNSVNSGKLAAYSSLTFLVSIATALAIHFVRI